MFENIAPNTFEALINSLEDAVILDVRSEAELIDGSIEGHIMIDINSPDFYAQIEELDKEKTYLVYCRSGQRSMRACMELSDEGFEKLYNLAGGIKAWNAYKGV